MFWFYKWVLLVSLFACKCGSPFVFYRKFCEHTHIRNEVCIYGVSIAIIAVGRDKPNLGHATPILGTMLGPRHYLAPKSVCLCRHASRPPCWAQAWSIFPLHSGWPTPVLDELCWTHSGRSLALLPPPNHNHNNVLGETRSWSRNEIKSSWKQQRKSSLRTKSASIDNYMSGSDERRKLASCCAPTWQLHGKFLNEHTTCLAIHYLI